MNQVNRSSRFINFLRCLFPSVTPSLSLFLIIFLFYFNLNLAYPHHKSLMKYPKRPFSFISSLTLSISTCPSCPAFLSLPNFLCCYLSLFVLSLPVPGLPCFTSSLKLLSLSYCCLQKNRQSISLVFVSCTPHRGRSQAGHKNRLDM